MAFSDELGDRVAGIKPAALDAYDRWLREQTQGALLLNEAQTSVRISDTWVYPEGPFEEWQADFDRFVGDIDTLVERFEKYYPLDAPALSTVRATLSRNDVTALSEHWGADPFAGWWPTKVVDRIYYAANIVDWVAEPPDMRADDRTWNGRAAAAFNRDFLAPFEQFAARQIFCGVYLANVADIFFNAALRTQRDLKAIVESCAAAFRDDGSQSLSEHLSDLSVFANLLGFVLPSPFDDIAGGASMALEEVADRVGETQEQPEWSIDSGPPWSVLESAVEVMNRLENRLANQDDRIYAAMDQDVSDFFYSADFDLRPDRAEPPDQIDNLEANIQSVYEFGARYLPAAATQYAEARSELEECDIPDWFGDLIFPRSRWEFLSARSGLRPALVWSHDDLTAAGEALVTIANEYDIQDADIAAAFEQFKESLPPPQPANRPS